MKLNLTNKIAFLFLAIVILAFSLRTYKLAHFPPALNLDEVAMGYDAYSILKTGHDQYGRFLPIYFQSHDDYKPPFIIYSQVPSIALLGLTDFAVRLPSAIYGALAVIFTFLLCRMLFPGKAGTFVGLLAALALTVSPWHLQFTRTAYEVGIQPFLTTTGLYFFLLALDRKKIFFALLSGSFLGVSTHLYTASRVFIPLLVFLLLVIYFRSLWAKKTILVSFLIGLAVFLIPTIYLFTTPAGQTRYKGTNIFQNSVPHDKNINRQIADWLRGDRISAAIFHPQQLEFASEILNGYFVHLRPDFIFLGISDGSTNYVPNVGLAYIFELPFFFFGLIQMFRKQNQKSAWLILAWILISPIPASVTYGIPTSIRTAIMLPALQIVTAIGLFHFFGELKKGNAVLRATALVVVTLVAIYSFGQYLESYYIQAPVERSEFWYPSYKQMVQDANELGKNYDSVIVSTNLDQPQSFFLYYLKYDPATYLSKYGGTVSGSYAETRNHFEKFFFKPINWGQMQKMQNTLFVGRPDEFGNDAKIIKKYYYNDGKPEAEIAVSAKLR